MSGPDGLAAVRKAHREVYDRQAARWDALRDRSLFERGWLDRFLAPLPQGAAILDLGCGSGEPIAAHLLARGCRVTGVDFAPAMLALARSRLPGAEWIEADLRGLDLGRRFDGILGWDSFFHLSAAGQRRAIPRLAGHLRPGGALMLTVGPAAGEAAGTVGGERVAHASLSPQDYRRRLEAAGLSLVAFVPEDPDCAGHSVLLARA